MKNVLIAVMMVVFMAGCATKSSVRGAKVDSRQADMAQNVEIAKLRAKHTVDIVELNAKLDRMYSFSLEK